MRVMSNARDTTILLLATGWFGEFISLALEKPSSLTLTRLRALATEAASDVFDGAHSYFDVDFSEQRQARSWQRLARHIERAFKEADRRSVSSLIALLASESRLAEAQMWGIRAAFVPSSILTARFEQEQFPTQELMKYAEFLDESLRQALNDRDQRDESLCARFPAHEDYLENRVASAIIPRLFFLRLAPVIASSRGLASEVCVAIADSTSINVPLEAMLAEAESPSFEIALKKGR